MPIRISMPHQSHTSLWSRNTEHYRVKKAQWIFLMMVVVVVVVAAAVIRYLLESTFCV
jgi:hypothetical protein